DPMREAAKRLAFRSMSVGKDFGDEAPDDRSLTDGMRGDEREDAHRHDAVMLSKECPGNQAERANVAERANEKQRAAAQSVNQPEADKRKNEIGDADADRLQQRSLRSQAGQFKDPRSEIENRVDPGELVEKGD